MLMLVCSEALCKQYGVACAPSNVTRVIERFESGMWCLIFVDNSFFRYRARHGALPAANTLDPVILVPGLAGSGLDASIDKNYKPAWMCFKKWTRPWGIWLNLYEALVQVFWVFSCSLKRCMFFFKKKKNARRAGSTT